MFNTTKYGASTDRTVLTDVSPLALLCLLLLPSQSDILTLAAEVVLYDVENANSDSQMGSEMKIYLRFCTGWITRGYMLMCVVIHEHEERGLVRKFRP